MKIMFQGKQEMNKKETNRKMSRQFQQGGLLKNKQCMKTNNPTYKKAIITAQEPIKSGCKKAEINALITFNRHNSYIKLVINESQPNNRKCTQNIAHHKTIKNADNMNKGWKQVKSLGCFQ